MAVICHGCGGVVGRDCFNPQECEQITRSLANQALTDTQRYGGSPEEILNLLNEKDDKIEELEIKADSLTRELSELREELQSWKNEHNQIVLDYGDRLKELQEENDRLKKTLQTKP